MRQISKIGFFVALLGAFVLAGRFFVAPWLDKEALAIVLVVLGVFSGVAPSFLATVMGKLDQTPPKEMSRYYADRMWNKMNFRRGVFWRRYAVALVCAALSLGVGLILKLKTESITSEWLKANMDWVKALGMGAALVGLFVAVLAVHEYRVVVDALRDLAKEMDGERRKREFLAHK